MSSVTYSRESVSVDCYCCSCEQGRLLGVPADEVQPCPLPVGVAGIRSSISVDWKTLSL